MSLDDITLAEIEEARVRLRGLALDLPLVRLEVDDAPAEIYLKLENLQPIGSFKVRGAGNALLELEEGARSRGVFTASAGNMALGLAYVGRRLGTPVGVVVPDHAPEAKLEGVRRLGARIEKVPFDVWWQVIQTHRFVGSEGVFIHPVSHRAVIAGNGTIGLEILDQLPDVTRVLVPYGGGGLSCGIATALRHRRPEVEVLATEVETAAPFAAALAEGQPCPIEYRASFVDGIGGKCVLEEMWPLASRLLCGSVVVSLDETAAAMRTLARRTHVVAEGAGATSVAAALSGRAGGGKIVCVVSGGNIDRTVWLKILSGETPR